MATKRSRGNGRAVRMVDGPATPGAPPTADVVAEVVAKADSSVDFVIRVFWRLPFFGVEGSMALLSSACARDSSFKRRRWCARLFRAESEDEENFEKKIVSRRWGMCEARYADVRIRVAKYGRDGRGDGADTAFSDGFAIVPATCVGSSGTI